MSFRGLRNWPPVWARAVGRENEFPTGEVGVLRTVELSKVQPANRLFLEMDHEGLSYIACLIFDDSIFCIQIAKLLQDHCNRPIAEIGNLDLSFTF